MKRNILPQIITACAAATLLAVVSGCKTENAACTATPATSSAPAPAAAVAVAAPVVKAPAVAGGAIRIKAGAMSPVNDSAGNVWQAEKGFEGGDVAERPDLTIANTKDQDIYRSEHYSMESFSCDVPNGKYLAKLHFAETFEGITGPGERVFSFNVLGREFKDFDIWAKAGGPNRAYVETVPVEVTNGKFKITFTSNVENPTI
ncbi:MAG TPA: malectin, partial [Candidatus Paceibacterota bacterium]|nr:malectin [Candidatus Paceibacterota bacterium]